MRFELFRLLLAYARELDAGDLILHPDCRSEHAQPLVDLLSNLLGQRANLLGILLAFHLLGEALDFGNRICLDGSDVLRAARHLGPCGFADRPDLLVDEHGFVNHVGDSGEFADGLVLLVA